MSAVIWVILELLYLPFPGVAVLAAVVVAVLASDEELLLDEDDVPDELEVVLDDDDVPLELELPVVSEELEFWPLDEVAANPSCWSSNSLLSV